MHIKKAIGKAVRLETFSAEEMESVFSTIMSGEATPAQIGGLLIALRMKGIVPSEIVGAARAMRDRATPILCPTPELAVDTCGTGGDGSGSVNISTMAAIVTASAGGLVAKHGNRAQSSRSGSADVLEALGVKIDVPSSVVERCLKELRIGFLYAPAFHAATKHASGPRRELGTRTIFNLLGPLTNPAGAENQVLGVFSKQWCEPVATALGELGAREIFVVHGEGGIDEVAVAGKTQIAHFSRERGGVQSLTLSPKDFGLAEEDPEQLAGGSPQENAEYAQRLFAGEKGAGRSAVLMSAALALCAGGVASNYLEGVGLAQSAIDEGRSTELLGRLVALTNRVDAQ